MTQTVVKLRQSRLEEQRTLVGDVDLEQLNLAFRGAASQPIRELVLEGWVERTIEGASTVELRLFDRDRELLKRTRYLGREVDIRIDGLWFRLAKVGKQGSELTLLFESREVALLRSYPKATAPNNGYLKRDARSMSRPWFARELVREVKEVPIAFECPALAKRPTRSPTNTGRTAERARERAAQLGFPPNVKLTVKVEAADRAQVENISQVLEVGAGMLVPRKLLVASIMVIIQESTARNLAGGDRDSVGLFQQRASMGWPASRDVERDATAFFEKALDVHNQLPSLPIHRLCSQVQRDYTLATTREGADYARWRTEAERAVNQWGVPGGDTSSPADVMDANRSALRLEDDGDDTAFQFTRGSQLRRGGRVKYEREDNWTCLGRHADEIGWRRFESEGVVWFISEPELFRRRPVMAVREFTAGVDTIDGDYDPRKPNAVLTVTCRLDRWQAPPGSVVAVEEAGIFAGRWLVASTRRSLFNRAGSVTLKKPRPVIPEWKRIAEDAAADGETFTAPAAAGTDDTVRGRILAVAAKAHLDRASYRYVQKRPIPASLFANLPLEIDCSAFVTLAYKHAGAPDPNGNDYNGAGYTGTLVRNGTWTGVSRPGDLVFYGDTKSEPSHVALFAGDGNVYNMGPAGLTFIRVKDIALPLLGYMTYPLTAADAAAGARERG